jgi:hypothetical protein
MYRFCIFSPTGRIAKVRRFWAQTDEGAAAMAREILSEDPTQDCLTVSTRGRCRVMMRSGNGDWQGRFRRTNQRFVLTQGMLLPAGDPQNGPSH